MLPLKPSVRVVMVMRECVVINTFGVWCLESHFTCRLGAGAHEPPKMAKERSTSKDM